MNYILDIYLVLGPHNVIVSEQHDFTHVEDAEEFWERNFSTRSYASLHDCESGRRVKIFSPK